MRVLGVACLHPKDTHVHLRRGEKDDGSAPDARELELRKTLYDKRWALHRAGPIVHAHLWTFKQGVYVQVRRPNRGCTFRSDVQTGGVRSGCPFIIIQCTE